MPTSTSKRCSLPSHHLHPNKSSPSSTSIAMHCKINAKAKNNQLVLVLEIVTQTRRAFWSPMVRRIWNDKDIFSNHKYLHIRHFCIYHILPFAGASKLVHAWLGEIMIVIIQEKIIEFIIFYSMITDKHRCFVILGPTWQRCRDSRRTP